MSRNALLPRVGAQRPRRSQLPAARVASAGPDACTYAESLGYELDDWQRWCIDGILSEDDNYRLCATVCCLLVARQNGKNVVLEVVELYCFFILEWRLIVHTAHRADTSAGHMARLKLVINANPELAAIVTVYESNGKERIERNDTGAEIRFYTRSKKIGRSTSPQLIVLDEALYATAEHMAALLPSMAAQSMNEDAPLFIYTSSAPRPESLVLHQVIAAFVEGRMAGGWFADWGAESGVDPNDRKVWYETNPGLGIRISEAWIAEQEVPQLTFTDFMIERLGVVFPADTSPSEMPEWPLRYDGDSKRAAGARVAIAVDVAPDLTFSSIGLAALRDDEMLHVELIEHLDGTKGTVAVLKALHVKHQVPIWLDPRSESAGLLQGLKDAGVPVVEIGPLDHMKACVQLRQLVVNGGLRHRGQDPLDAAVMGAAVKAVGEGWAWARRSSAVDISPLEAITIAAFAAGAALDPVAVGMYEFDD